MRAVSSLVVLFLVTVQSGGFDDGFEDETTFETTSDGGDPGSTTAEGQVAGTTEMENEEKEAPVRPTRNTAHVQVAYEEPEDSAPYPNPTYDLRVNRHLYDCQATPTLVAFPNLTDSAAEYIVPGVRINRCNGCDCGKQRSCQPIADEPITFLVEVKHYNAKNKRGSLVTTLDEVTLDNHTACKCMCKNQCGPPRVLNTETCTCVCAKKTTCPRYFQWNNARCACQCSPKQVPCAKPKVVDPETCQCRDHTEANVNRTQMKKKPTEVDDINSPL